MSSIVCLSHREDVDGILSAALIKALSKTKRTHIVLADYANILSKLQKIASTASNGAEPVQMNADFTVYSSSNSNTNSKSLSISSSQVSFSDRQFSSDKKNKEPSMPTMESTNANAKNDNNSNSSRGTARTGKPKRLI